MHAHAERGNDQWELVCLRWRHREKARAMRAFDRSHVPRGNAALDALRPLLEA